MTDTMTSEPAKYRKRPVTVEAIQFDGTNTQSLIDWTNGLFADIHPDDRAENPENIAEVWNFIHATWVGVRRGDWIIRGTRGEFYPCAADVFAESYEPVA